MFLGIFDSFVPIFDLSTYVEVNKISTPLLFYSTVLLIESHSWEECFPSLRRIKIGCLYMLCIASVSTNILSVFWQIIISNAVFTVLYTSMGLAQK